MVYASAPPREPHRVSYADVLRHFDEAVVIAASATTADRTQRKRLVRRGDKYLVMRRYLSAGEGWEVVIESNILSAAVDAYNRLS